MHARDTLPGEGPGQASPQRSGACGCGCGYGCGPAAEPGWTHSLLPQVTEHYQELVVVVVFVVVVLNESVVTKHFSRLLDSDLVWRLPWTRHYLSQHWMYVSCPSPSQTRKSWARWYIRSEKISAWDSYHWIRHRHYCIYCSEIVVCAFVDVCKMTSVRIHVTRTL